MKTYYERLMDEKPKGLDVDYIRKCVYAEKLVKQVVRDFGTVAIDPLVEYMWLEYKLSERDVKEAVLRLREEGIIDYNRIWEMYVNEY